ncbi:TetR/AcrR family transcriptional regulator [Sphingomonas bacterium]|uniref:TetR/AcrR family transcriptional regulator n=1 Tax=Sphingomonas bacterium TaxID=1895847 RepID=UPI001575883D|nr:TetR/AcrR family transcriptional regulator [Sphingomonas bacterium]
MERKSILVARDPVPDARPSKRAAYREATRRKILAAARPVLLGRGVEATAMDDIAAAASVSRATVYQHFAGMQMLLVALVVEDWEGQARLFAQLDPGSPPNLAALSSWLKRVTEGFKRAKGSLAVYRAALVHDDVGTGLHRGHRDRLARLLCHQLRDDPANDEAPDVRVEAAMIVAEIEYLATAGATVWRPSETEIAIAATARRMLAFAAMPARIG